MDARWGECSAAAGRQRSAARQGSQLGLGNSARHRRHAAVGAGDELVAGNELQCAADRLGDFIGRLDGVSGDVDAAGIIFYGAYIRFFEIAETELFRSVGLPYTVMFEELDLWLPRRHLECDFLRPAKLDDMLEVAVCVGRVGNTESLHLEAAGVGLDERGRVWCDANGGTWASHITAAGDVVGFRAAGMLAG